MLNKTMSIGRVGRDPEVRYTKGGDAVASFSIAMSEHYKDRQGVKQEKTEWIEVGAWAKLADFVQQYMKKGALVYVEGRLQTRDWTDKDSVKHYKTSIRADVIRFVGPNPKSEKPPEGNAPKQETMAEQYGNDSPDDIPF